jgi:hypothetical protein
MYTFLLTRLAAVGVLASGAMTQGLVSVPANGSSVPGGMMYQPASRLHVPKGGSVLLECDASGWTFCRYWHCRRYIYVYIINKQFQSKWLLLFFEILKTLCLLTLNLAVRECGKSLNFRSLR